jgi:hypothetical protein
VQLLIVPSIAACAGGRARGKQRFVLLLVVSQAVVVVRRFANLCAS